MEPIVLHPEVSGRDERRHARFEGRVPCRLLVGDLVWNCWIRDLSAGGAGLEPAMPATLGQRALLTCPAFDFATPLPGRVVNVAHRRTCIDFDLGAELEAELVRFLDENTELVDDSPGQPGVAGNCAILARPAPTCLKIEAKEAGFLST